MYAAPDAHHSLLFAHLPNAGELTLQAGVGGIRYGECRRRSGAEYGFEDGCCRAGLDSRLRRVLRMHRLTYNEVQPASRSVASLPSMSPLRIAVIGRQKL